MKNLKLSLKKEIISDLEAKEIKGGEELIDTCKYSCVLVCPVALPNYPPPYSENCYSDVAAYCESN